MNEADEVFDSFVSRHKITFEDGESGSYRNARCTCGARWRAWYTDLGIGWEALNDYARVHDEVESLIMTREQYALYAASFGENL